MNNRSLSTQRFRRLATLLAISLSTAAASAALATPTPIWDFNFNETTIPDAELQPSITSGVTTGVSGKPNDFALDNTASPGSGAGAPNYLGRAFIPGGNAAFTGLQSFTLTGWYQTSSFSSAPRLLQAGHVSLYFNEGSSGTDLRIQINSGSGGSNYREIHDERYLATNEWVFFAISYDSTLSADNVHFYVGNQTTLVESVGAFTLNQGAIEASTNNSAIGNAAGAAGSGRPLDGLIDNFRLFGSAGDGSGALSLSDLELIRGADLNNSQIPETSSIALLAGVAASGVVILLRRRTK